MSEAELRGQRFQGAEREFGERTFASKLVEQEARAEAAEAQREVTKLRAEAAESQLEVTKVRVEAAEERKEATKALVEARAEVAEALAEARAEATAAKAESVEVARWQVLHEGVASGSLQVESRLEARIQAEDRHAREVHNAELADSERRSSETRQIYGEWEAELSRHREEARLEREMLLEERQRLSQDLVAAQSSASRADAGRIAAEHDIRESTRRNEMADALHNAQLARMESSLSNLHEQSQQEATSAQGLTMRVQEMSSSNLSFKKTEAASAVAASKQGEELVARVQELEGLLSHGEAHRASLQATLTAAKVSEALAAEKQAEETSSLLCGKASLEARLAACESQARDQDSAWDSRHQAALMERMQMREHHSVELHGAHVGEARMEAACRETRAQVHHAELKESELAASLQRLEGETQHLVGSYELQCQQSVDLDKKLRCHLELLELELIDLRKKSREASAAVGPVSGISGIGSFYLDTPPDWGQDIDMNGSLSAADDVSRHGLLRSKKPLAGFASSSLERAASEQRGPSWALASSRWPHPRVADAPGLPRMLESPVRSTSVGNIGVHATVVAGGGSPPRH